MTIESIDKAIEAAKASLDKKAKDVTILELKKLSVITDYFVICSAESTTQMKTIVENIEKRLLEKKQKPIGIEGLTSTRWILMDYGDVIVHVFDEEARSYYELEKFWMDAPRIQLESKEELSEKTLR